MAKGVYRIDNEQNRTHGWAAILQRRGKILRKFFSDGKWGGNVKAKEKAAAQYRMWGKETTAYTKRERADIRRTTNSSGTSGVSRVVTRDGQVYYTGYFQHEGRRYRRKWSVKKWGEDNAKAFAVAYRNLSGFATKAAATIPVKPDRSKVQKKFFNWITPSPRSKEA